MNVQNQMETANDGDADAPPPAKGLKFAVYTMGILLVVGFIVVFSTIVYRTVNTGNDPAAASAASGPAQWTIEAALPEGARIIEMQQQGDRLAVRYSAGGDEAIMVFDIKRGYQLGRIDFSQ
jgi:hypothetical protein